MAIKSVKVQVPLSLNKLSKKIIAKSLSAFNYATCSPFKSARQEELVLFALSLAFLLLSLSLIHLTLLHVVCLLNHMFCWGHEKHPLDAGILLTYST